MGRKRHVCVSVPKECVLGYRTGLQSGATGFLMPDQRHFLSLLFLFPELI